MATIGGIQGTKVISTPTKFRVELVLDGDCGNVVARTYGLDEEETAVLNAQSLAFDTGTSYLGME